MHINTYTNRYACICTHIRILNYFLLLASCRGRGRWGFQWMPRSGRQFACADLLCHRASGGRSCAAWLLTLSVVAGWREAAGSKLC